MTTLAHIVDRVLNRPLLILPDKLAVIAGVLNGRIGIDASGLAPDASRFVGSNMDEDSPDKRARLPYRRTSNGVGIVTITGSLVNRGAWIGSQSGMTSYEGIKYQIDTALSDPKVSKLLLDIDSPGGEAIGAFETAAAIRKANKIKPVTAMVNGMAASAAYALASGAGSIISADTGLSGSIGVVMMHADYSRMLDREGVTPTFIYAGAHKVDGNSFEPLSKDVRSDLQAEVDRFYDLFVDTVVKGRKGMNARAVRATEARTFLGQQAKEIGLVDDLGTFDDVLGMISAKGRSTSRSLKMNMETDAPALTQADIERSRAAGHAAGFEEGRKVGLDAGRTEGVAAERTRIKSILTHEDAKGREATAQHFALNTDLSVEAAVGALAGVPKAMASVHALDVRASNVGALIVEAADTAKASAQSGAVAWSDIAAQLAPKTSAAR